MAVVTRRYRRIGVNPTHLSDQVGVSCTVDDNATNTVTIQFDDSIGGSTEALDEEMDYRGFEFEVANEPVHVADHLATALFYAKSLDFPNSADWAVNSGAPASADSNNASLTVCQFRHTVEDGAGFQLPWPVPIGATSIMIELFSRPEVAAASNLDVIPKIYTSDMPSKAAQSAWTAGIQMATLTMGTSNEFFQTDSETFTLAALGLTAGNRAQFELTRDALAGGDTLVGFWDLQLIGISFT